MLHSWRYACYNPQHDKEKEYRRGRDSRLSRGQGAGSEAEQGRIKRTGPEGRAYPLGEGEQAATAIGKVAPQERVRAASPGEHDQETQTSCTKEACAGERLRLVGI